MIDSLINEYPYIIALALFMPVFFDWGKNPELIKAEMMINNDLNTI